MDSNKKRELSISEVSKDFSKAAEIADSEGSVVVSVDNEPRYMIVSLKENPVLELSDEEKVDVIARRVLKKYHKAFEELAK